MKESRSSGRILLVLPLLLLFACALSTFVGAQGLPQVPGPGNPSNDCGCSRGDDAIPVSSGMLAPFLPRIPNLELGFLYYFGNGGMYLTQVATTCSGLGYGGLSQILVGV